MNDNHESQHNPYFDENHQPYNQTSNSEDPNQQPNRQPKPNALDEQKLRSAQTQTTFAFVAGPLSLFLGGILLGGAGAICAFLAFRKLKALSSKTNEAAKKAVQMMRSARAALAICLVAVIINAVSLVLMYPVIVQMLQNGDYASVAGNMGAGTATGTSTWG